MMLRYLHMCILHVSLLGMLYNICPKNNDNRSININNFQIVNQSEYALGPYKTMTN